MWPAPDPLLGVPLSTLAASTSTCAGLLLQPTPGLVSLPTGRVAITSSCSSAMDFVATSAFPTTATRPPAPEGARPPPQVAPSRLPRPLALPGSAPSSFLTTTNAPARYYFHVLPLHLPATATTLYTSAGPSTSAAMTAPHSAVPLPCVWPVVAPMRPGPHPLPLSLMARMAQRRCPPVAPPSHVAAAFLLDVGATTQPTPSPQKRPPRPSPCPPTLSLTLRRPSLPRPVSLLRRSRHSTTLRPGPSLCGQARPQVLLRHVPHNWLS
jgi:hypothetical protein